MIEVQLFLHKNNFLDVAYFLKNLTSGYNIFNVHNTKLPPLDINHLKSLFREMYDGYKLHYKFNFEDDTDAIYFKMAFDNLKLCDEFI